MSLLGLHQPGDTWLHRRPAGHKLVGFLVVGVVVVAVHGWWSALLFLAAALALVAWSRMGVRTLLVTLRRLLVVAVLLAAYSTWQQGWQHAVEVVGDLLALVLAATVLTVTTPIDEVLDAVTAGLRPLRRIGIDPERVGLTFALMIRAIPTTIDLADETRDAARARGLERDVRARLVPFVIRVVAHARDTGAALHARGIGDD